MYVITGATGNTGKVISHALLDAGKKIRIICRDEEKAKDLTARGAELFLGDTSDVAFLQKAFAGATAVYALIPMNWTSSDYTGDQVKHANAMAEAVKACNVKYVVSLSSQGAHLANGSGVVLGLGKMEKIFDAISDLNTLHLRPTYFFENTLGMIDLIKQTGIMGSPVKTGLRFPMISTNDIGKYAAKRLISLNFKGKNIQDLLGAEDVTYPEVAKVYGSSIGLPNLSYVEFSYTDFKSSLTGQMGASENVADMMNEFIKAMNDGKVFISKRTAENTTPTTLSNYSKTFSTLFGTALVN